MRLSPAILDSQAGVSAAVVLLLANAGSGLQVLFIERAKHESDPWSGDVGFPGGRSEPGDNDLQATAVRETFEEVGIALGRARYLGRLSDIDGGHLGVRVSCFVFGVDRIGPMHLSNEVRDAFWVPLVELTNPARHGEASVRFGAKSLQRPAIRLPQADKPVLWGLTYRLVMQFLEAVGKGGRSMAGGEA
ncbi:MAG: CoA pyrophosphatase [Bacteroidota bacterium]